MFARLLHASLLAGAVIFVPLTAALGQSPTPGTLCGLKPQFNDPAYAGFTGQIAVSTHWASGGGPLGNSSLVIWNLKNQASAPKNVVWNSSSSPATEAYAHSSWDVAALGDVRALTIDQFGDIYLGASRFYSGSARNGALAVAGTTLQKAGQIYKIANGTGVASAFAQLPNHNGTGIGGIHSDGGSNSIYATDLGSGNIYQLDLTGALKGTPWHHGQNLPSAVDLAGNLLNRPAITGSNTLGYALPGSRVVAIAVYLGRVFFSVWNPAFTPSEVWSVARDAQGSPVGPARLELSLPPFSATYTGPVTDMAFGRGGRVMFSESTLVADNIRSAHQARDLEYVWNGVAWVPSGAVYHVGIGGGTNAAGSRVYDFGPPGLSWGLGDALHLATNDNIYGLQGIPLGGGTVATSVLIDLDGQEIIQNKTQLGAVRVPCPPEGQLKVCKVAGPGVAVGTLFTFTVGSSTFTVPAGPAPGGTCVVGPTFPVGSVVTLVETVPPGDTVSSITVDPPGQLVGAPNLATGTVNLAIGSGVTEVTYTDKRTGFLEICKRTGEPAVTGSFTFTVNQTLGPIVVPVGACSPAIEVPAGLVTITEALPAGTAMSACSTIPATQQVACTPGIVTGSSTVNVDPGDVSQQTIAFITNRRRRILEPDRTRTSTAVSCAPNPAPLNDAVTCIAKVTPASPDGGTLTGTVSFKDGDVELARVPLRADGSATFTTSTLAAGSHAIVSTYDGNAAFAPSVSEKLIETIRPR